MLSAPEEMDNVMFLVGNKPESQEIVMNSFVPSNWLCPKTTIFEGIMKQKIYTVQWTAMDRPG